MHHLQPPARETAHSRLAPSGPSQPSIRRKVGWTFGGLLLANVGAWAWALIAFHHFPLLLGSALLAYSFGLRHAVDADHIAAIDNVTRKLMQSGERPVGVGLMFSLGHSTVVLLGSLALSASALSLQHRFAPFERVGSLVGTLVSALFLFAIALVNVAVLRSVFRAFQRVRRGEPMPEDAPDLLFAGGGLLSRLLRPIFRLITRSWHMYPLGVLFGLGFDTATEIGLLALSAAEASRGLPLLSVLVFPVLFAAGMALVDTTDNLLMLGAYGWAFRKPVRKLYYNVTVTSISVLVAVLVGGVEMLGLVADRLHPDGAFWSAVTRLNSNFGLLGYGIIAVFVLCWLVSYICYHWLGLDDLPTPG